MAARSCARRAADNKASCQALFVEDEDGFFIEADTAFDFVISRWPTKARKWASRSSPRRPHRAHSTSAFEFSSSAPAACCDSFVDDGCNRRELDRIHLEPRLQSLVLLPRSTLTTILRRAFQQYPVVTITGPRRSGKTTFWRTTFPRLPYVNSALRRSLAVWRVAL